MQTVAMLEDWAARLKEPWTRPLLALDRLAADLQRKTRHERAAFRHVDPAALLRHACLRTREPAAAKNVALLVHCSCGPLQVQAEPFGAALFSLLHDAIKATSSRLVLVSVREDAEGEVLWQIRDGLERRVRNPLASAIVERHGGLLRFDSAPELGTCASIWLPPSTRLRRPRFAKP
jgi:signal transduction histidine kinase